MRVGKYTKFVTLARAPVDTNDADGFYEPLDPAGWWCAMQPQGSLGEGRTAAFLVTGRYHPQITVDTRILYADPALERDRELFVRAVRNRDEANIEMECDCEEILP